MWYQKLKIAFLILFISPLWQTSPIYSANLPQKLQQLQGSLKNLSTRLLTLKESLVSLKSKMKGSTPSSSGPSSEKWKWRDFDFLPRNIIDLSESQEDKDKALELLSDSAIRQCIGYIFPITIYHFKPHILCGQNEQGILIPLSGQINKGEKLSSAGKRIFHEKTAQVFAQINMTGGPFFTTCEDKESRAIIYGIDLTKEITDIVPSIKNITTTNSIQNKKSGIHNYAWINMKEILSSSKNQLKDKYDSINVFIPKEKTGEIIKQQLFISPLIKRFLKCNNITFSVEKYAELLLKEKQMLNKKVEHPRKKTKFTGSRTKPPKKISKSK